MMDAIVATNCVVPSNGHPLQVAEITLFPDELVVRTERQVLDDPDVAAVTPIVHRGDDQAVVAAGLRWSLGGARKLVSDPRVVAPGSGRLRAKILGPTLTAAFYRRDVLVAIGGFETAIGDELADAAAALDLQSLGKLCVCEPASRLAQTQDVGRGAAGGFASGRAAERIFWRHASAHGLSLSLALHPFTVAVDMVRHGAAGLTSLIGRAAAWFEVGAARRHEQRLIEADRKLLELAELRNSRRGTHRNWRHRLPDRPVARD